MDCKVQQIYSSIFYFTTLRQIIAYAVSWPDLQQYFYFTTLRQIIAYAVPWAVQQRSAQETPPLESTWKSTEPNDEVSSGLGAFQQNAGFDVVPCEPQLLKALQGL